MREGLGEEVAGGVCVASSSGKLRSSDNPLADGWLDGAAFDCGGCEEELDCAEPAGEGVVPALCVGVLDCEAPGGGGFNPPESEPLPCCALAPTTAAITMNTNSLPLMFLFYLWQDYGGHTGNKKTGRSKGGV
jgi:hypothetical protein